MQRVTTMTTMTTMKTTNFSARAALQHGVKTRAQKNLRARETASRGVCSYDEDAEEEE